MINKYCGITKSHTLNNFNKLDLIYECSNQNKKLNIVLDLDNTIIFTKIFDSKDILKIKYYELFKKENFLGKFNINGKIYFVYIRPYFSYFLNTIKMYFNLFIYTNSQSVYCENIIKMLKNKYSDFEIKKIICKNDTDTMIKQLAVICENQDDLHFLNNVPNYSKFVKKTIIIDDDVHVWKFDIDNLINVRPFNFDNIGINSAKSTCGIDDTLLILTNRLFIIYNFYNVNILVDNNYDVKKLISKYKLLYS